MTDRGLAKLVDRNKLREEIAKYLYYCNHKGESLDWEQTRDDIKRKYYSQTNHILSLPTIARALAALEDLEGGRLVRLAEDQSWPADVLCGRCEGSGRIYADGKAHYYSEGAPTIDCPACGGHGSIAPTPDDMLNAGFRRVEAVKTEDSECRWCFRVVGDEGMCSHCPRRVEAEKGEQQ